LIDKYDVYQHLMTYWNDTMQDDVYTLVSDGWLAGRQIERQEKKKDWDGLLIPKALMIKTYFQSEQDELDALVASREELDQQLTEMEEEHGGDEGIFSQFDKITKANLTKRLKELKKTRRLKRRRKCYISIWKLMNK
jgi:type I restriction enzyme M protein